MNFFSIPADFSLDTIDKLAELNEKYPDSKVIETYGNITVNNSIESGRTIKMMPKIDLLDLQKYVDYSIKNNIQFSYTLNASQLGNREFTNQGIESIQSLLYKIYNIGIRRLTICLPPILEIVKDMGLDFEIKVSIINHIRNANNALEYKGLGVDRVVVDESIYRDFENLREIRNAFGEKVEIIVNSLCQKDCVYRLFHYNQTSCDSLKITNESSSNYYLHRCVLRRFENEGNILRIAWIRPEDLIHYTDVGINYFKIQGRQYVLTGDIIKVVESYMKGDFEGDLMDLLYLFDQSNHIRVYLNNKNLKDFIKPFYTCKLTCKHNCTSCNYCDSFAKKVIEQDEFERIRSLSKSFYSGYDQFSNALNNLKAKQNLAGTETGLDVDFNV